MKKATPISTYIKLLKDIQEDLEEIEWETPEEAEERFLGLMRDFVPRLQELNLEKSQEPECPFCPAPAKEHLTKDLGNMKCPPKPNITGALNIISAYIPQDPYHQCGTPDGKCDGLCVEIDRAQGAMNTIRKFVFGRLKKEGKFNDQ